MKSKTWIILRSDLPESETTLLLHFCQNLAREGELPLLCLPCKSADVSHHIYTEARLKWKDREELLSIRVPHHLVSAIFEFETEQTPLGFQGTI